MLLNVFCLLLSAVSISPTAVSVPVKETEEYFFRSGDFILGGLFSFHPGPSDALCSGNLDTELLIWSETMLFAVKLINEDPNILPNYSLGFYIRDDCDNEDMSLWSSLRIAGGVPDSVNQTGRERAEQIVGIVGPADSTLSILAAKVGSLYQLPVMAIYATSRELHNPNRFPYFLRAVPPDHYQVEVILDILVHFDWLYTALIYSADSYGINGGTWLMARASQRDVCFAFTSHLPVNPTAQQLQNIVQKIVKTKELSVIVMFATFEVVTRVLEAIAETSLNRQLVWIGTDAWPRRFLTSHPVLAPVAEGSIIVRLYKADVPGLYEYIASKNSTSRDVSPWLREWFYSNPGCTCLRDCPIPAEPHDVAVVHSVYTFAYALHAYIEDRCKGLRKCRIEREYLMGYLHNVSFNVGLGNFRFDKDGEPAGRYLLKQVQKHGTGYSQVDIGDWDTSRRARNNRLRMEMFKLKWKSRWDGPPVAKCSETCDMASVPVALERKCCTGCSPCLHDQMVNGTECLTCPNLTMPSPNRTVCVGILPYRFSWNEPIILSTVVLANIGLIFLLMITAGMIYYRNHTLVKAGSRELSALNLLGLMLSFITIFPLYAIPTVTTCSITEIMMSCSIAILFGTSFLKANRIYRVFEASKKTVRRPRLISPRDQLILALILIAIQATFCTISAFVNPSVPEVLPWPPWELYCPVSINILLASSYNLVLIALCCYFAFRARKVPDNYNESKFIAISVYTAVLVCLVAVPVYVTTPATLLKLASCSFALIFNGYLTLIFMYLPKLYGARLMTNKGRGVSPNEAPRVTIEGTTASRIAATRNELFVRANQVGPHEAD